MTGQQEYASIPRLLASYSGSLNYINKEGTFTMLMKDGMDATSWT